MVVELSTTSFKLFMDIDKQKYIVLCCVTYVDSSFVSRRS